MFPSNAFFMKTQLFAGISEAEIEILSSCIAPTIRSFQRQQVVFLEGETAKWICIVLQGCIQISKEDYFGNRHIVANITDGQLFAESYALAGLPLQVSAISMSESNVLFLDCEKLRLPCSHCCDAHKRLIQNLLQILSKKNLQLSYKLDLVSRRSTREKLLTFLSNEAIKAGSNSFSIPFNRQELADYLCVERSAMSAELSKLQREGLLQSHRNQFILFKIDSKEELV